MLFFIFKSSLILLLRNLYAIEFQIGSRIGGWLQIWLQIWIAALDLHALRSCKFTNMGVFMYMLIHMQFLRHVHPYQHQTLGVRIHVNDVIWHVYRMELHKWIRFTEEDASKPYTIMHRSHFGTGADIWACSHLLRECRWAKNSSDQFLTERTNVRLGSSGVCMPRLTCAVMDRRGFHLKVMLCHCWNSNALASGTWRISDSSIWNNLYCSRSTLCDMQSGMNWGQNLHNVRHVVRLTSK